MKGKTKKKIINNKNKKRLQKKSPRKLLYILIISLILLFIVIGLAFSYAFWGETKYQSKQNLLDTGCLSFTYNDRDVDNNITSISVSNRYPITDSKGITEEPYVFTLTNTCSLKSSFKIYLHSISTSTMDPKYIKAYLNDSNSNVIGPKLVTNFSSENMDDVVMQEIANKVGKVDDTYLLDTVTLDPNAAITYNLRLWIDYDAPNSVMGTNYNAAVSVLAVATK